MNTNEEKGKMDGPPPAEKEISMKAALIITGTILGIGCIISALLLSGVFAEKTVAPAAEPGRAELGGIYNLSLGNDGDLEMIKIYPGTFLMGNPEDVYDRKKDGTFDMEVHSVTLTREYYIGKYEVTQLQWKAVMGTNPSEFDGYDHPVDHISWADAMAFCEKLNSSGKAPYGWKFTLPTEAQWEYACRADTSTDLNNGKNFTTVWDACTELEKLGWYNFNSNGTTQPVGKKLPNAWGLYDMHGNIAEWCLDWYEKDYAKDPEFLQGNTGTRHVYRGGSWGNVVVSACGAPTRFEAEPDENLRFLGFRVVLIPAK